MVSKIQPTPGPLPSKRKCENRPICATYGYCSPKCEAYKKTTSKKETKVQFEEIVPDPADTPTNAVTSKNPAEAKFESDLHKTAAAIIAGKPECIQVSVPLIYISTAISYFKRNKYKYLGHILSNPSMPLLLFER